MSHVWTNTHRSLLSAISHLSPGSSIVRASLWRSEGCGFDSCRVLRNCTNFQLGGGGRGRGVPRNVSIKDTVNPINKYRTTPLTSNSTFWILLIQKHLINEIEKISNNKLKGIWRQVKMTYSVLIKRIHKFVDQPYYTIQYVILFKGVECV